MSIGKFSASGISFNNENTAALANVAVDVSLVRCNAPIEFAGVGTALTTKRRHEAENGGLHTTAVKLGYLFHDLVPNTPKLIAAFGNRVSEILEKPGINPQGTEKDGPFRDYVGAECTSIWAAATSTKASLPLLLLACLLARAWSDKEATSIWVEIIELRKQQISDQVQRGELVNPYFILAAQKRYNRSDLALWDSSTRAWLARADAAMNLRLTQLRLVSENVKMPSRFSRSTMDNVLTPWIQSMEMMEALLDCKPQELTSGVGLIAMSAWHLFPNLLVFQDKTTSVPFNDNLFPSSSIVSIGIENGGTPDKIAQWSLSLSHLRHYGDPVTVHSSGSDRTRIPPAQLWIAALGIVFRQWDVPYPNFDSPLAWFNELHEVLSNGQYRSSDIPFWIVELSKAAASVRDKEILHGDFLVKYGYRHGHSIFGLDELDLALPFFGLRNPYIVNVVRMQTIEDLSIEYLRSIAKALGLQPHEGIILGPGSEFLTTIAPIPLPRSINGQGPESQHMRWYRHTTTESQHQPPLPSSSRHRSTGDWEYPDCSDYFIYPIEASLEWTNPPSFFGPDSLTYAIVWQSEDCALYSLSATVEKLPNPLTKAAELERRTVSWSDACALLSTAKTGQHRNGLIWALKQRGPVMNTFKLLKLVNRIYTDFPHATVPLKIVRQNSYNHNTNYLFDRRGRTSSVLRAQSQLQMNMAIIAWMEMGSFTLGYEQLKNVMAIAFEDKIYIAESMLRDPSASCGCSNIRCVVGSIGHSGMALLVSPTKPRIKVQDDELESLENVMHSNYDRNSPDSFASTTLHLSFTDWTSPLDWNDTGAIDRSCYILESVLSVRHGGTWVADIDVIGTNKGLKEDPLSSPRFAILGTTEASKILQNKRDFAMHICRSGESCTHQNIAPSEAERDFMNGVVSIDTWEELLDYPPCHAVFRANRNWAARLAATYIHLQAAKTAKKGKLGSARLVIVKGDKLCVHCIRSKVYNGQNLLIIH